MPSQLIAELDGITLRTRTWRAAQPSHPAVVLLPATAETAEDWDVVAAALSSTRSVHAVDLRGHGASDWPGSYSIDLMAQDVVGLLAWLGKPAVDLVGHSLGGLVACSVAATSPERVRRLVLEDVGLLHPRAAARPARPEGDLPFDWRVVEQVRPEIDHPSAHWGDLLRAIVAPTLAVAGGPSSPVPQGHVSELVDLVRDGRMVTIDSGHLVHATHPDEFTSHLVAFLDRS